MQLCASPQSAPTRHWIVGVGLVQHVPDEHTSPVPQSASTVHGAWHRPPSSQSPPPHSPEYVQVASSSGTRASLHSPSQQTWPSPHSASVAQLVPTSSPGSEGSGSPGTAPGSSVKSPSSGQSSQAPSRHTNSAGSRRLRMGGTHFRTATGSSAGTLPTPGRGNAGGRGDP